MVCASGLDFFLRATAPSGAVLVEGTAIFNGAATGLSVPDDDLLVREKCEAVAEPNAASTAVPRASTKRVCGWQTFRSYRPSAWLRRAKPSRTSRRSKSYISNPAFCADEGIVNPRRS